MEYSDKTREQNITMEICIFPGLPTNQGRQGLLQLRWKGPESMGFRDGLRFCGHATYTRSQQPALNPNKPLKPCTMWQCRVSCTEVLEGHCMKLWRWSISFDEVSGLLKIPWPWEVCQGRLQTQGGVQPRKRLQVLTQHTWREGLSKDVAQQMSTRTPSVTTENWRTLHFPCWVLALLWSGLFWLYRFLDFRTGFFFYSVHLILYILEVCNILRGVRAQRLPWVSKDTMDMELTVTAGALDSEDAY